MIRIISICAIEPSDIEDDRKSRPHQDDIECYFCGDKNPCVIIYSHTPGGIFNDYDLYCQKCISPMIADLMTMDIYQEIFKNTMAGKETSKDLTKAEIQAQERRKEIIHNHLNRLTADLNAGEPNAVIEATNVYDKVMQTVFKKEKPKEDKEPNMN